MPSLTIAVLTVAAAVSVSPSVRIQSRVSLLSRDWRQVQFDECQKQDEPHNQVFLAGNFSLVISVVHRLMMRNHVDESILLRVRIQRLAMAVLIGPSFSAGMSPLSEGRSSRRCAHEPHFLIS